MATEAEASSRELLPEPAHVTVFCSECKEHVAVEDIHAYLLGLHQRVCGELAQLNGQSD